MKRQEVVGGSEPPCHADAWLLSPLVSRRISGPVGVLSGPVDESLSLKVSRSQSALADELSSLADELLCLQVSRSQSAPVDELSGPADV